MQAKLNEVKAVILDIFKEVSSICQRNNIPYFALCGTCIGAVRHNGFIPWDDDLDIGIPIEEFFRFMDIAKKELPSHLELYTPSTAAHYPLVFIKVIDNRTTAIETTDVPYKDTYKGIWIDIMPIAGVPEPGKKRNKFIKKALFFLKATLKTKRGLVPNDTFLGKLMWIALYPCRYLPHDIFWKKWLKWISKQSFKDSKYIGNLWEWNLENRCFPKEWFEELIDIEFEDTKIKCPKQYDKYLRQSYGNYMEFPPEKDRNSGHDFSKGKVDVNHSYKDYQTGKLKI